MLDLSVQLEGIQYRRVFPWLQLTRAFWIAVDPRKLLLSAAGLLLIVGGARVCESLPFAQRSDAGDAVSPVVQPWPWQESLEYDLWHGTDALAELQAGLRDPWNTLRRIGGNWQIVLRPVVPFVAAAVVVFRPDATLPELADALLKLTWAIFVWAIFGGAIARIAAIQFARDENIGLRKALKFSISRFFGYITAPFLSMVGIGILWLLCVIGGGIGRIPVAGPLVIGILWGMQLLIGFLMAVVLVGLAAGWPLMFATIAVEGSDGFDGLSRAYNYVFERPLYYLWQLVIAMLYGSLAVFVVWMMAQLSVHLASWGVAWGMGAEQVAALTSEVPPIVSRGMAVASGQPSETNAGTALVAWWTNGWAVVLHGFVHSFFWTTATIMYFLLRRSVDANDFDEVFVEGDGDADELLPLIGGASAEVSHSSSGTMVQGGVTGGEQKAPPVDLAP